jgi:hypothetical protein
MKNFLLGVVAGIVLVVGGFYVLNNYIYQEKQVGDEVAGTSATSQGQHPLLNDSQEQALKNLGIDPAKLPSALTSAQEECFIEKLGQVRVDEIIAGDTPTAMEVLNTAGCLGK